MLETRSAAPVAAANTTTTVVDRRRRANSTEAALCTQVYKTDAYLDEWVDYNLGLGFHAIYLYDNSPNHCLKAWGAKRRLAGDNVHTVHNPGSGRQLNSFHSCVKTFGPNHTYLAFFDVDEFLVLFRHDTVTDLLLDHLPEGALTINSQIFGTANRTLYAPIPVTKRFQYRLDAIDARVKSVLKVSDYGGKFNNAHSVRLSDAVGNRNWRDTGGPSVRYSETGASHPSRPGDVALLYHYRTLSAEEWRYKSCERGHVSLKVKECNANIPAPVGSVFDDRAWQTLIRNVPRYRVFDNWDDYS
jgi:Glycosyl transferase family 2